MPCLCLRPGCGLCLQVDPNLTSHCVARISFVSMWLAWSRKLVCRCEQCTDMSKECPHAHLSRCSDVRSVTINTHRLSPCPPASGTWSQSSPSASNTWPAARAVLRVYRWHFLSSAGDTWPLPSCIHAHSDQQAFETPGAAQGPERVRVQLWPATLAVRDAAALGPEWGSERTTRHSALSCITGSVGCIEGAHLCHSEGACRA